ncbi:hydrogenase formation protein HypD [bacterium]|nr:hydrogenase formation protein HypD [bacterium]
MKHLDEYRNRELVEGLAKRVAAEVKPGQSYRFMEVCGTHTMAVARAGLRHLLPKNLELLSGPGCPVCVTPIGYVDAAVAYARRPNTVICTFGDLVRVPGSTSSLIHERAKGADIRVLYSPLELIPLAKAEPEKLFIFLGVGFETTTPTVAGLLDAAEREGLKNFALLGAHKTMPAAMAGLTGGELGLHGFLLPGHVSVITGLAMYRFLVEEHSLVCAVTGFEAVDLLEGILELVDQVNSGKPRVANRYPRAVTEEGNPRAQQLVARFFEPADAEWRGLGVIPLSGLKLREEYSHFDALAAFPVEVEKPAEPKGCRCGEVLCGLIHPPECGLFGKTCTPENPVGACMVSSEGACAAYYKYR